MATYTSFTTAYGTKYANLRVRILEQVTGVPAIVMASATSGILSSHGNALLDGSGNLSVFLDNSKTWQVWNNQFVLFADGISSASDISRSSDQIGAAPTVSDISLGPGATFFLENDPTALYRINAAKNQYVLVTGGGGSGTGTVKNTAGPLTSNAVVLGAGLAETKVLAGFTTDGISQLNLGVQGASLGKLVLNNSTAGASTIVVPTVGAGSFTITLPAVTDILVGRTTTDTLTNKTLTSPTITGTLTGLTLATPTISSPTITGTLTGLTLATPTISSPTITGTLTGLTLATPTISSPTITGTLTGLTLATPTITSATVNSPIVNLATPGSNNTAVGTILSGFNAGATITLFSAVYMDSAGKWQTTSASGSGTYPCRGIATAAGANNATMPVLTNGIARNDSWTWTPGADVYIATTSGALTQTAPGSTGNVIQKIGFATSVTTIQVNVGSAEYMTHA